MDSLAIIANVCRYNIRITNFVRFNSLDLEVSILVQGLLNSDISMPGVMNTFDTSSAVVEYSILAVYS